MPVSAINGFQGRVTDISVEGGISMPSSMSVAYTNALWKGMNHFPLQLGVKCYDRLDYLTLCSNQPKRRKILNSNRGEGNGLDCFLFQRMHDTDDK